MSSDLKKALLNALESRGTAAEIRSRVRAELFASLDNEAPEPPMIPEETFVINELIMEYLQYNNYQNTYMIMKAESGMGNDRLERDALVEAVNVEDTATSRQLPLLYSLFAYVKDLTHGLVSSDTEGRQAAESA
eukprot:Clim_evm20s168 gene=Clim_evmTU20s168